MSSPAALCSVQRALLPVLMALTLLAGCAGNPLRSYDKEMGNTLSLVRSGNTGKALELLEKNNTSIFAPYFGESSKNPDGSEKDKTVLDTVFGKDLLYYFEKGELLRMNGDYAQSRDAWLYADEIVKAWEDEYRTNLEKFIGIVGTYLINVSLNDRTRRYDGQDYEKVFLSARLALDHVLLNNFEHARVEMKKTFEREKLIESFREHEYLQIKAESEKQGISFSTDELGNGGYPVNDLDSPEIRALKNGYQNAFAHYLSGYFFEMNGEYSLAAPGYRNALALRPDSKLIRDKVNKVGQAKPGPRQADVLFVVESGFAPAWKTVRVKMPVRTKEGTMIQHLSFPILAPDHNVFVPPSLRVGEKTLTVETIINVNALAYRQLKDQLPGIIARAVFRAVSHAQGRAASIAAQRNEAAKRQKKGKKPKKTYGKPDDGSEHADFLEQADERSWRTLPSQLAIARAILPHGELPIEFRTANGAYKGTIKVSGKMTIVPIRLVDGAVFLGQASAQAQQ
jgi:hypothetical protein